MALSVVYFRITHRLGRPHYVWDEYLYSLPEKVEVRVTVSVIELCGMMMMKGREKVKPVPAHSLIFSKSTKRTTRLNHLIRRTVGDFHKLGGQKYFFQLLKPINVFS